MSVIDKLITDLKDDDFTLDLSSKRSANQYGINLEELNEVVSKLIQESTHVISNPDETSWDFETLYCFENTYFVLSGGGMSSETIESCNNERKKRLIKKWKK